MLPEPQQPGGVGLGLVWLLWGGVLGLPFDRTVVTHIPHMTGGGWLAMGWLSGTDSVHPSAATSTGEPQLRASFGCQTGLNHWTQLVQKAPKAQQAGACLWASFWQPPVFITCLHFGAPSCGRLPFSPATAQL